ncbi:hypothetical protein CONCODRAFT_8441 [Conidiobolus coronatus NRRL 28638]|uniref:F-box domain-containing protein n=1 Tax=Conidiobolus coronatus (strain ATCC 28846 / CBS 209.66 / NRRL 28638) TaxID=796925 RepID=A0A137P275_CONC2|nr:hypothetical protein CONCODRAFT_8441 [Conidiobolus coronatus NRRL 28638]|eukprot:KXN69153.1 hypothetical protein CONCODRAFT_8441 [Conidiobolus coronatus NRRL 28638]
MDIKQSNYDQAVNWEYLTNMSTLLRYLNGESLVELSKCCKRYRNQLEKRVLDNFSIYAWERNNMKTYRELKQSGKIEEVLEFMKTDLGSKIKFIKKLKLSYEVDCKFAEKLVKLLPDIKFLSLYGYDDYDCSLGQDLTAVLKYMKHLEHLYISGIDETIDDYSTKKQIFPKSIKYLRIDVNHIIVSDYGDGELSIYDTIDTSYINLYSLTIVSNRMIQNLSLGMPNLKELEIRDNGTLNQSKIVEFLKANRQLKKITTNFLNYDEEIIKTMLFSKYLEHWSTLSGSWKGIEINNLPSNYSIKYLKIYSDIPTSLTCKIVNSCKNLETLDTDSEYFNKLDLLKFKRRINVLNLSWGVPAFKAINEIDSSSLFNQVDLCRIYSIEKYIDGYNLDKLMNYKPVRLISGAYILKLINIAD